MANARIMIVEDQNIIAMDLESRLTSLGYLIPATVAYGEEAITRAGELMPDLVLMDIMLKGAIDGVQAADQIRQQFGLPIIYLTAHSDNRTLERARLTEPYGYILKPFEDRELHLTIEIALYKHQMEKQLREHERWLAAVLKGMGDGVIAADVQGNIQFVNPAAEAMTGWSHAEAQGRSVAEIFNVVHAHTRARIDNPIHQALERQEVTRLPEQALLIARDGREIPVDDSAAPIRSQEGLLTGAVLIFRDVTERKRAEEQLRHLAYHDTLTGLPNRSLFQILVGRSLADAQRHERLGAILFLDLDRFKNINDTLGHATGDQLLKAVAARLTGVLRQNDTVARIGGDEFTILIEEIEQPQDATLVAEKLLNTLAEPFDLAGQELFVSASIGIGIFPTDGQNLDVLLRNADTALYRTKEQGRNGYTFYQPEMNATALTRLALENDLQRALQRGEFVLYYQPKVTLDTGRILSAEALLHWQHPELGLTPPEQFLSIAEDTGLILPIGEWVLRTACRQAKAWQAAGLAPLRVAVNFSNREFRRPDMVALIEKILAETGLPASALEVEFLETVVMKDRDNSMAKLQALRQIGVFVSIDDFGIGYSSLEYIRQFQIDGLKIDHSFVSRAHADKRDEAVVRAIVALAHNLSIRVTAEGVETLEQYEFMKTCLCDEAQGFYFGHPMAPDVFMRFMKKGSGMLNTNSGARP
ncbi:MAG: EAL domain-containing protein [Chloroflexi bacterium]|nr:EAL domain-containing protein [Chloroflexota bacterium]